MLPDGVSKGRRYALPLGQGKRVQPILLIAAALEEALAVERQRNNTLLEADKRNEALEMDLATNLSIYGSMRGPAPPVEQSLDGG